MATKSGLTKYEDIPCCPELETNPACDVIDFRRRLVFPTSIRTEQGQVVRVEVTLHTRFSRCSGPLALGDLAYSHAFQLRQREQAQLPQRADLGGAIPHALDARLHLRPERGRPGR